MAKWYDGSSRMKRLGLFYIKAAAIRTQQDRRSGSLGPINHDLHSFIQHIQTQTHISLPASSADSSFLLLFNMWPYARILVSPVQVEKKWDSWQQSSERLVLDLLYSVRENASFLNFYLKKTNYIFKVMCITSAHKVPVYIFPFFQVNARRPLGLMEFIVVSDRVWIGLRKWGGKRGIRGS